MFASILLVDTDRAVLRQLTTALTGEGVKVATATSFKEAEEYLAANRPDLLVAAVRLGAFNGIGLAMRAREVQANLAIVIMDTMHDSVLEHEAGCLPAPYIVHPIENAAFLSNVKMALTARGEVRSTAAERLRSG